MINLKKLNRKWRQFVLCIYFTLYHYQKLIDANKIYFNREKFRKVSLFRSNGYCLFEYGKLYPPTEEQSGPSPLTAILTEPTHLKLIRYFYLFYILRCFTIA